MFKNTFKVFFLHRDVGGRGGAITGEAFTLDGLFFDVGGGGNVACLMNVTPININVFK